MAGKGARLTFFEIRKKIVANQQHLGRVVFWMIGALLSFSVMAVSIRALGSEFSVFEILALRSGLGVLVLCGALVWKPQLRREVNFSRIGVHGVRNVIHLGSQYLWASGILLLPLATVFALEFTMPAWTALLATFFLGEKMTPSRAGVIVFGIIGVLVILRPGVASFQLGSLLVLGAALGYATTMITTKMLTATHSTFAIIFWMNVMQLPLAMLGSDPLFFTHFGPQDIWPIIGIGIAGTSSHFCLSQAFRNGDATVVVPIDFLRIPLIAVVGWFLYSEHVDAFVFVGAGIIIVGVLWNLRAESRRARPDPIPITEPLDP